MSCTQAPQMSHPSISLTCFASSIARAHVSLSILSVPVRALHPSVRRGRGTVRIAAASLGLRRSSNLSTGSPSVLQVVCIVSERLSRGNHGSTIDSRWSNMVCPCSLLKDIVSTHLSWLLVKPTAYSVGTIGTSQSRRSVSSRRRSSRQTNAVVGVLTRKLETVMA